MKVGASRPRMGKGKIKTLKAWKKSKRKNILADMHRMTFEALTCFFFWHNSFKNKEMVNAHPTYVGINFPGKGSYGVDDEITASKRVVDKLRECKL